MNLRTRAIAVSILPFIFILAFSIPEFALQQHVSSATEFVRRSGLASGASRDIQDARLATASALRRRLSMTSDDPRAFVEATRAMRASMLRFASLATQDSVEVERARLVSASAADILRFFQLVDGDVRSGRLGSATAILDSAPYLDRIANLQNAVRAFSNEARRSQAEQFVSLERLWNASILLLALAFAGSIVGCSLLIYYTSRAVHALEELGRKGERYRRGEPLGPASTRRDELGRLDAAVHEFVAAQQLREQQLQRYRLLAEVTHDLILFIDRFDLTIIDANAAALETYGYERSELIGKPTAMLHAAEDPIDAETIALSDSAAGLSYEGLHQRADGSVFPVEVHARTAEVGGRLTIVKTIRDISERRRAAEQVASALDQAIEASRLKSEFVATMSHEIRTPMYGVIGMSELLLETPLMPVQREYAATVKESAQALLAIIDDILDFSKLEANKLELEAVAFDPAQVVASVVALARGAARDKGLTLRSYASPHVPKAVRGDPTRLRQILMNLVGNAVKFTAEGEVTVAISLERDDGRMVVLEFAVRDTGIGVDPQARERLFDAFVQGDGGTTRRFGGTGLGLSISRRLVDLMGGRIWLGDHEGPGSTFCFTVVVARTEDGVAPIAMPDNALRVLVLDDDESTRRGLEASLASWGMHGASVPDVEAARTQLRQAAGEGRPFDVVMIAYALPRSDGLTFAGELAAPEYGQPASILMTAFDAVGRKEAALRAGCVAYLQKPIDPSVLYDLLHEIERASKAYPAPADDGLLRARILLAEDSALIRRVARHQLEELECDVDIVENGLQAVVAVAGGDYQLVLMDMRMPEMDGLAATRAIRAAERETGRHIVVVALTANVMEADRDACVEAGMDDFLAKPMQLDALRAVLARWLPERV